MELREGQLIAVVYVEHVEMLRVTLDEVGGRMGKESEDTALNVSGQAGDVPYTKLYVRSLLSSFKGLVKGKGHVEIYRYNSVPESVSAPPLPSQFVHVILMFLVPDSVPPQYLIPLPHVVFLLPLTYLLSVLLVILLVMGFMLLNNLVPMLLVLLCVVCDVARLFL